MLLFVILLLKNLVFIKTAVCSIIQKKQGIYQNFFENFDSFIKENFLKNFDKILSFSERKNKEFINKPVIITGFYSMRIKIDYEKVIENLNECKSLLN